eukprot:3619823-Prymnesium_polylepis.1
MPYQVFALPYWGALTSSPPARVASAASPGCWPRAVGCRAPPVAAAAESSPNTCGSRPRGQSTAGAPPIRGNRIPSAEIISGHQRQPGGAFDHQAIIRRSSGNHQAIIHLRRGASHQAAVRQLPPHQRLLELLWQLLDQLPE